MKSFQIIEKALDALQRDDLSPATKHFIASEYCSIVDYLIRNEVAVVATILDTLEILLKNIDEK